MSPTPRMRTVPTPAPGPARKLPAGVGLGLGAVVLAVAAFTWVFGGALLDSCAEKQTERAFARAHPGCALRIGGLHCALGAQRLAARSVTLTAANATFKAGRISLTGVRWAALLWGAAAPAEALAKASLEATNLEVEFPRAHYGIRCARLRASVPDSELSVEESELRPLVGDEEFFAAHDSRTTRFHVVLPACRVLGLAFGELFEGRSYRAGAVHFYDPSFEALVDRDKPKNPFRKPPLMVHEALAAIRQPFQIDRLSVTRGHLRYGERVVAGAAPGVLTFGAVSISAQGIANRAKDAAAIRIQAQGDLMEAGRLTVRMTLPLTPPDFSLHYSGSLGAMDLTRLDAFLEIAEHTRIKSGSLEGAAFDIDVQAGHARGTVRAVYRDLELAFLNRRTGSDKGLEDRVVSFFAKELKIRRSNAPDPPGSLRLGDVNYAKKPEDEFLQFAWFALRSGVLDVIRR